VTERWPLPNSWIWCAAEDISSVVGGGTPDASDPSNFDAAGVPWLTPADLTGFDSPYIAKGRRSLSNKGLDGCGATILPKGSVLLSSRAPIGYCVIASNPIATNQGFKSLVPEGGVSPEFIRYYCLSSVDYLQSIASGTTFLEVSGGRVRQVPIPVAPLPEQRRIVAKIDALLTRSKRARADLGRVEALAARANEAILGRAYTGQITERWRHSAGLSPSPLVRLGDVCSSISDGDHQAPPKSERGVPFVTISAMNSGALDLRAATRFVPQSYFDQLKPHRQARLGDILYSVTGSIGIAAPVVSDEHFVFQRHIALLRPNHNRIDPLYLLLLLGSPQVRAQALEVATGTAQLTIPLTGLRDFLIRLPSHEEQLEVVRRVLTETQAIERGRSESGAATSLLNRLDQSILAKAFRGELVPQDPADEPGSDLLDRIHAERAKSDAPQQRGRPEGTAKRTARRQNNSDGETLPPANPRASHAAWTKRRRGAQTANDNQGD
jgi:type I restriction enzyme S subunit